VRRSAEAGCHFLNFLNAVFTQVPGSSLLGTPYTRSSIVPAPTNQTIRGGEGPTAGYHRGTMGWRGEIRDVIAQLEQQRGRLEEARVRAKRQGGPEGERLEAQATARLREIEERIADLRASLE
jgi:hypothetical protein